MVLAIIEILLAIDTETHLLPFPSLTIADPGARSQSLEMDIPLAS
jgi:hypothetical protein